MAATKAGEGAVYAATLFRNDTRLVLGGADQLLRLWDVGTNQHLLSLEGPPSGIQCIAFSPQKETVVTGHKDGQIVIWDGSFSGQELSVIPASPAPTEGFEVR